MTYEPDLFSTAMKMFFILAVLMGGLWAFAWLMKRMLKIGPGSGDSPIRVLANAYVGVKKSVSLVEVPGAILVLGVTSDRISLLTKIEDEEILAEFKNRKTAGPPLSFSDHLSFLSMKSGKGKMKEKE